MLRRVGSGIAAAASYIPSLLRDLVGLAAVGAISYGAWMLQPAAGFIVGGILVLVGVTLLSVKAR